MLLPWVMVAVLATPPAVAAIDPEAAFAKLGLDQHLSPTRRNGVVAMVARIKAAAGATA